nr:hypothetical protein [Tanacetum cinerariifolium]
MEKAQAESKPTEPNMDDDINTKLGKKFLMELKNNAYHRMFEEDVVDHIAKVLKKLDLIKIPCGLPSTTNEVEKFFCKFYLESHDGEDEMLDEADNWGIDPLEIISQVNSSFENHMRVDERIKKVLFHSWMNENLIKRRIEGIVSCNNKWEESNYGNPPNASTNSFFKPYLKPQEQNNTKNRDELSQMKHKDNKINDEQLYKRICKTEKFKAINYLLGPNEEYISIKKCEYDAWERNEDSVYQIYQEIFRKKDEGWMNEESLRKLPGVTIIVKMVKLHRNLQLSGSESRPPMLNKENYVPWSSRLLRYAKSRPNGKLIHNSIINGPYVIRMILEPGDTNREVPVNETFHVQTDDELAEKELKQIEADDQATQTILLGLPKDIYAAVDSCETAQEIWLRVQQMMKGSNIGIQEKKAKLFNEWEMFTSNKGESIESYYHRFLKLMNDLKRNKHFSEKIASNLKFLNNLQPEWSRHVTIIHQTKDLHTADYTQLYDFLKYNQKEVDELKVERLAKTQDPLALMENSNNSYNGNCNLVAARAEGNAAGHNGNQIRKEEAGIQLQAEEFDLMAAAAYLDEIEEVNANCIFMANLQQTSTSGTQTDKAPVYDSDGSAEETRALYDSLYHNLAIEVKKVNSVNRKLKETNADLTTKLARFKNQEKCFEISQEKYDKLKRCYQQSVYQEQCLSKKINALHLSSDKQIITLNEEISDLNKQLSKEKSTVSFLFEEKKKLKSDFKTHEDELLDKQIQFEKKIKELNNILVKTGQSIQTIHMLSPKPDSFYHTEQKMALGYYNPFYLKQAQKKQQSLYDGKVLLEKHDPPVVHDSEETLMTLETHNWSSSAHQELHKTVKDENFPIFNQVDAIVQNFEIQFLKEAAKFIRDFKSLTKEADESLTKQKALEWEIKRLLRAVVSQDIMSVVQKTFVVDTSNLQTELERTKEHFENCIIKNENEYAKLWNDWYKKCDECKYDKISYDKAYKDMQQKIKRFQAQLGDLKGKSKDTSCVSDTLNPLSQKLKNENVELEFQVLNYSRENAHLKTTYKNMFDSIYVLRTQTKTIIASLQKQLHNSIYENAKLRAQLFNKVSDQKDNKSCTSAKSKFAKQSIVENLPRIDEIHALSKLVTSNSVLTPQESKVIKNDKVIAPGMFRIDPFKTSREEKHVPNNVRANVRIKPITVSQHPVITKKDSSQSKNKGAEVEEHHRNLLLSKNTKHMSSACNNIKLNSQNVISKVVCAMCKQCLISVNHDVCLRNYVNGKTSSGKKHKANVSIKEKQKKLQPQVKKLKKVGFIERLATPKPRKLRFLLRWSPTGRLFDQKGKIVDSSESESQSDCSNGDNACTSNTLELKIKRFPNSTSFRGRIGSQLILGRQFCDSDLKVAFRRNACFVKNLKGVDLLKGDRSTNLYTINLHEMASASLICLMARASSTKSWLWHQPLSHLNFDTINDLARNDLVSCLLKFKYHKEHLCPSCEQGKSKRASHLPKPVLNSRQRLHLLHMDLCGPMRIASINGKRYVLVIVDDYSRYTWVHFLRSKDKEPEVIKTFLKRITVLLQSHVIIIRTDNGTEFKNQVLKEYFDSVGISRQISSVRTAQQNGAEAIATACFTQNRSIIHCRFNKTPYELINDKKPDISFLHLSGALCYPKNDREDIGKLDGKGDIGFFIGYSTDSCAYRIYNRRTKKIMETMNVSFDELSAMAFEQRSSKPELQRMTSGQITMYDDYIGGQPSATARIISAAQKPQDVYMLNQNAMVDGNTFVNSFVIPSTSAAESSSSQNVDPSNMHTFYQPYPHEFQWTKDHPLEQVIGEPSRPILTRNQLRSDGDMCMYALTAKPIEKHLKEVKMIFYYLRGTVNTGLWYTKDSGFELTGFSDADYAGCKDTFKSTSSGAQFLGEKLVSWYLKKQDCTTLSTAEVEYVSLSACYAQVLWMRTQLTDYGFHFNKIPIDCDLKSAIAISCNPVQHSRTKHIDVHCHFIKEHVENGTIELYFVKMDYQLADLFTKALPADRFNYLVRCLGMHSLSPQKLDRLAKSQ